MDRIEDHTSTEDRYSRERGNTDYGDSPEIWRSGREPSASATLGDVASTTGESLDSELEYPAHPVVGEDDGELLFESSDPGQQREPVVEPDPVGDAASDDLAISDRSFVERRSQPWLSDGQTDADVAEFTEAPANSPWPTLDISAPAVSDTSVQVESGNDSESGFGALADAETPLDLNVSGYVEESSASSTAHLDGSAQSADEVTGTDGETVDGRRSCRICTAPVSQINIKVDGNVLILESCDECDSRRWRLDGQPIDLKKALDEVGEHAGRRQ